MLLLCFAHCALAVEPLANDGPGASANAPLAAEFRLEVTPLLVVSAEETAAYARLLDQALDKASVLLQDPQFIVLVDRNPHAQALLLFWGTPKAGWQLVGATPVSTGLPGRFEHFATPLGVFEHTLLNPDFRAEGTRNEFGIRGYGRKGSRVFDFGWVPAPKGWGNHAMSVMRLQMHATDPDVLEPRLGTAQSKGCVRIPARLAEFIDRRGVLDADYEDKLRSGARLWVLRADREPTLWPGRFLVVVESGREA